MERNGEEQPVLIAQTGPLNGQRWVIREEMTVGREFDCDIVVPERQVSRHHARFTPSPEGIVLEDMGSKNGTHYNGEPISEPVFLKDGDVVQIALAQQFVYVSSDSTIPLDAEELFPLSTPEYRLRLNKRAHRVWIGEEEVVPPLSAAQYTLLELLDQHSGQVVSREEIIEAIWGEEEAYEVSNQALDALVRRLRDRLAAVDDNHSYIVTVRGHGLRLDNPQE